MLTSCEESKKEHTQNEDIQQRMLECYNYIRVSSSIDFFLFLCPFFKVHLALHSSEHIVWPGFITSQEWPRFYVELVIGVAIEAITTTLPLPQDSGGEEREAKSYSTLLHLH